MICPPQIRLIRPYRKWLIDIKCQMGYARALAGYAQAGARLACKVKAQQCLVLQMAREF